MPLGLGRPLGLGPLGLRRSSGTVSGNTVTSDTAMCAAWSSARAVDVTTGTHWSAAVSLDSATAADWRSQLSLDVFKAASWLRAASVDALVPVAAMSSIGADGVAVIDQVPGVARDCAIPADWSGALMVTAQAVLPLEFGAGLAATAVHRLAWLATLVGDRRIPVAFNALLIDDQQGALDWLRSMFGDAVAPGETLLVLQTDGRAPAEFAGNSTFVPGNPLIFSIDARGYVWLVDARSTTWRTDERKTVWTPTR
jgi:hypothetical protein